MYYIVKSGLILQKTLTNNRKIEFLLAQVVGYCYEAVLKGGPMVRKQGQRR